MYFGFLAVAAGVGACVAEAAPSSAASALPSLSSELFCPPLPPAAALAFGVGFGVEKPPLLLAPLAAAEGFAVALALADLLGALVLLAEGLTLALALAFFRGASAAAGVRVAVAAFAAAGGDDGPACTGAHAQPKTVNPGPAPVVRLEGPLALGHGYISSSCAALPTRWIMRSAYLRAAKCPSFKLNSYRRGPGDRSLPCHLRMGDPLRVLRSLPLVKPR